MEKQIVLVGFMGSGKSSVGRALSKQIGYEYCDTDYLIERQEECTIAELFSSKGEAYFRELETSCIQNLILASNKQVISTGGGLPVKEENQKILEGHQVVIYLKANPEVIYERVRKDSRRPLLQTEDPRAKIEQMLLERSPIYERVANYIIETDEKLIEDICAEIMEIIK